MLSSFQINGENPTPKDGQQ